VDPIDRLTRDLRVAARQLGDDEARYLVDAYYIMQDDRKRTYSQTVALGEAGEPNDVIGWLNAQSRTLENQIKSALDAYTNAHKMGSWMRSVHGIGPVLSAGLLAHIYMGYWCANCRAHGKEQCEEKQKAAKTETHEYVKVISCPTVGHIWAFAGIAGDGQAKWEKGQKRPYNAKLKTLCWKIGQSFMKQSGDEACVYGRFWRQRKDREISKNEAGDFEGIAAARVATVGKGTEARKTL